MIFEIDFNKRNDDKMLELLGATENQKYPHYETYTIELNTFEELEQLLLKVDKLTGVLYFETAKLLKEKGFDEECQRTFHNLI